MLKKRIAAAVAVVGLLAASLTACSSGGSPTSTANASGPITVEFWHSMTGAVNGPTLDKIISDFNALPQNQGKIVVKGVFQGTYDQLMAKYKAAAQTNSTPTMAQIYDIGSRFMIDSGTITPMQGFIDSSKWDVSDLQPNVAGYYTVDSKLYSMPFNTSVPVFYYNKDVFTKAGLDPNKPPTTLAQIMTDAKAIAAAKAAGKVTVKYPFTAAVYGWFVEQEIAANGDLYCSPDNGRSGTEPTQMTFDNKGAVQFYTWWQQMIKDGLSTNVGTDTTQAQSVFSSGASAMTLESTGALGGFLKTASFQVGVGNFPKLVDSSSTGPAIGGASLWIMGNGHSTAEQNAAWSFIQYVASPAVQAEWHVATGYFPISKSALNDPTDVSYRQKEPQLDVAVKQLENTPLTTATQGCSAGIMPQSRQATQDALEKVLTTNADPQATLTAAAQSMTTALTQYNQTVASQG